MVAKKKVAQSMNAESRTSTRKPLRCQAVLSFPNMAPIRVRTKDISLGGVSVLMPEQVATGLACMITFEAPMNGRVLRVSANAKVAYSILSSTDGFRTGLQFTQIDPASNRALAELMI
ncbi:MAG TPA: PilZ domain-containing protein [Noviherbaspirillum sp.]|nr:PilZ domain-containing protein [Noviherbaspirillum sp.]